MADEEKQDQQDQAGTPSKTDTQTETDSQAQKEEIEKQAKAALMNAVKQIGALVKKLMGLLGMKGDGYPDAKGESSSQEEDASGAQEPEVILGQLQFLAEELGEGRIPDAEAVEKAGKKISTMNLKALEKAQAILEKLITDAKGEQKQDKEETKKDQSGGQADGDGKDDKSEDQKKLESTQTELKEVKKQLEAIQVASGTARGEGEPEPGKEDVEKAETGLWGSVFTGTPYAVEQKKDEQPPAQ